MGVVEVTTLVVMETSLEYHPCYIEVLTRNHNQVGGQCVVGSLTGAVASQKVTEAHKVTLNMVGNHV